MERVKKIAAKVWHVFCHSVCSRVFAALLMCAVTLSMVLHLSAETRVVTTGEDVKAACDLRLSFSKMTFPHQLMRIILEEQI